HSRCRLRDRAEKKRTPPDRYASLRNTEERCAVVGWVRDDVKGARRVRGEALKPPVALPDRRERLREASEELVRPLDRDSAARRHAENHRRGIENGKREDFFRDSLGATAPHGHLAQASEERVVVEHAVVELKRKGAVFARDEDARLTTMLR